MPSRPSPLVPRRAYERAGFFVAIGVIMAWAVMTFAGSAILAVVQHTGLVAADDCDLGVGRRCGMRPRHDALTGCEYLETAGGGITPRMAANGHQVCRSRSDG